MSTRRKLPVTVPPKAATPSKRKRDTDSESEDSPDSESELSDLGEELEEPPRMAIKHVGGGNGDEEDEDEGDDDDEDEEEEEEEEEEEFDEPSDDDDTPEEAEDSYVYPLPYGRFAMTDRVQVCLRRREGHLR